ncbi:MAG TPA: MotA/TolQ/ExbB proton channel family protein, partial [Polyangiaceae bacterium]|nr:MotA/TolQ/ExbB proton channel family protein [Polyangiaceae bacterium]
ERWLFYFKHNQNADELEEQLMQLLEAGDREGAEALLDKMKARSFEAETIRPALKYLDAGPEAFTDCVDAEFVKVRQDCERGMNLLATLGNNAPFIGLMGTVIGVIISFQKLGQSQGANSMSSVMGGIAEALVSTGVGLFLALPAVVAYNILSKKVETIDGNVQSITKHITAFIKAQRSTERTAVRSVSMMEEAS